MPGVRPEDLTEPDLLRELEHLHTTRHTTFLHAAPHALHEHSSRTADLEAEGRKAGVTDAITGRKVGVRLEYVVPGSAEQLGRYITKLQAGFELTRGDLKTSRNAKGRLPFDLLDDAMAGDGQATARWREYEQAMTGKSAVRFSKGLRAHL